MSITWNLWHGCHKKSEGCLNCYVYRSDEKFGRDAKTVAKNKCFNLPIEKYKNGNYKIKPKETIYTCFTSDFFLEDADEWRIEAWNIIRERIDCNFFFITKRIESFFVNLPKDWNDGWENVYIGVTCENQRRADERLPIFLNLPIKHKTIICEPLLEDIDMSKYLNNNIIDVVAGGESGNEARICDYKWILHIKQQCIDKNITFYFKQTGAKFKKDGMIYNIARPFQHIQAKKANITYIGKNKSIKEF